MNNFLTFGFYLHFTIYEFVYFRGWDVVFCYLLVNIICVYIWRFIKASSILQIVFEFIICLLRVFMMMFTNESVAYFFWINNNWHLLGTYTMSESETSGRPWFGKSSVMSRGFPGGRGNGSACTAVDWRLMLGSGRSSGEWDSNLLQYSYLENSMDRGVQYMGSQRVRYKWATHTTICKIYDSLLLYLDISFPC